MLVKYCVPPYAKNHYTRWNTLFHQTQREFFTFEPVDLNLKGKRHHPGSITCINSAQQNLVAELESGYGKKVSW